MELSNYMTRDFGKGFSCFCDLSTSFPLPCQARFRRTRRAPPAGMGAGRERAAAALRQGRTLPRRLRGAAASRPGSEAPERFSRQLQRPYYYLRAWGWRELPRGL